MTLAPSIDELADSAKELKPSELAQLSDLLDDDLEELRSRWAEIGAARRREILSGGGGHERAAGVRIKSDLQSVKQLILTAVKKQLPSTAETGESE